VWEPDLNVTPRTDDFACGTLIAEVFAPEPIWPLLFVNHLPNWQLTFEHERELQTVIAARATEEIAEGHDGLHVVLVGDLDATPDSASVRFLHGRQSHGGMSMCYRDAWGSIHPGEAGHTFTAENPLVTAENWDWEPELGRRIDYIMVRCSDHGPTLDVRACQRIFDEPADGVGGATTSAWSPTFRPRPPADDRCTDRPSCLYYQGGLAEHPTDSLAQSHPRPPPLHPPAQGSLYMLEGIAFQDGEGRGASAQRVRGVEAPRSPRLRPRR
jgi:hypothetical protein